MTKEERQIVQTAYSFVISILGYGEPSANNVAELFEIQTGNKEVLLEHLKAINSITGKAIDILGGIKCENGLNQKLEQ